MSIEVLPGQVIRAESDTLVAKGIYTYLALAVRIKRGQGEYIGYMGYFNPENPFEVPLNEMLDNASNEAGDAQQILAWPAGCAPFKLPEPEVMATRAIVTDALASHSIPIHRALWIPSDAITINLRLNCDNGAVNAYPKTIA